MFSSLILSPLFALGLFNASDYDPKIYQLGSGWQKSPVTAEVMNHASRVFQVTALNTAQVAGGTGFYLGKFNGFHVVATNHHVCETGAQCLDGPLKFALLGKTYKLTKWIGTFKDIDLTLMAFEAPVADEIALEKIARNFAFQTHLYPGQKLLTIGFGVAGNPTRALVFNQDDDCQVMSGANEYRQLKDPDEMNPMPDAVWSFASGCDVSHGDSGSAMVDRNTGELIGILWTGRTPKNEKFQNSKFLSDLLTHPTADIWTELTYAVPATKMADSIYEYAYHYPYMRPEIQVTLLKLIGR